MIPYSNIFNVSIENIVIWIIFGIAVGILVHFIDRKVVKELENTLFFGVLGALVGGFLAQFIFRGALKQGINYEAMTLAVIGGLILSYLGLSITKDVVKRRKNA